MDWIFGERTQNSFAQCIESICGYWSCVSIYILTPLLLDITHPMGNVNIIIAELFDPTYL